MSILAVGVHVIQSKGQWKNSGESSFEYNLSKCHSCCWKNMILIKILAFLVLLFNMMWCDLIRLWQRCWCYGDCPLDSLYLRNNIKGSVRGFDVAHIIGRVRVCVCVRWLAGAHFFCVCALCTGMCAGLLTIQRKLTESGSYGTSESSWQQLEKRMIRNTLKMLKFYQDFLSFSQFILSHKHMKDP